MAISEIKASRQKLPGRATPSNGYVTELHSQPQYLTLTLSRRSAVKDIAVFLSGVILGSPALVGIGNALGVIDAPDLSLPRVLTRNTSAESSAGRIENPIADDTQAGWDTYVPVEKNIEFSRDHPDIQLTYSMTDEDGMTNTEIVIENGQTKIADNVQHLTEPDGGRSHWKISQPPDSDQKTKIFSFKKTDELGDFDDQDTEITLTRYGYESADPDARIQIFCVNNDQKAMGQAHEITMRFEGIALNYLDIYLDDPLLKPVTKNSFDYYFDDENNRLFPSLSSFTRPLYPQQGEVELSQLLFRALLPDITNASTAFTIESGKLAQLISDNAPTEGSQEIPESKDPFAFLRPSNFQPAISSSLIVFRDRDESIPQSVKLFFEAMNTFTIFPKEFTEQFEVTDRVSSSYVWPDDQKRTLTAAQMALNMLDAVVLDEKIKRRLVPQYDHLRNFVETYEVPEIVNK